MQQGVLKTLLVYSTAFALAGAAAWAVATLTAIAMLETPTSFATIRSILFPPLAGLATFALVFGLGTGHPMRAQFWLVGLALTFTTLGLALAAIWQGYTTPLEALVLGVLVLFGSGFFAALRGQSPQSGEAKP